MKGVDNPHSPAGQYLLSNSSKSATDEEAEKRLQKWESKLKSVPLHDRAGAQKLLEEITQGFAPPDDAPKAQAVFNDLIAHEAYSVFVDVFNVYNAIRAEQARGPKEPAFKSALILQMPCRWTPTRQDAFSAAMKSIQVERLELIRPLAYVLSTSTATRERLNDLGAGVRSLVRWDAHRSSFHAGTFEKEYAMKKNKTAQDKKSNDPVPAAVCAIVQTFLQRGTTDLVVRGRLKSPDVVAEAVAKSSCLRAIELGEPNPYDPATAHLKYKGGALPELSPEMRRFTALKMNSYETLMVGLAQCKTLQHLSICPSVRRNSSGFILCWKPLTASSPV